VRDEAQLVGGLLQALDAQTLPSGRFEVIVVDDGSRDHTPALVESWVAAALERRALLRGAGRGPAAARNLGFHRARGSWVAFTDGDTVPEPDWLEAALAAVEREQAEAIEGAVEPFDIGAGGRFFHRVASDGGGRYMTANMIYSRALLERIGGFDEQFSIPAPFLEDSDLAFRALEAGVAIPFAPEVRVGHPIAPLSEADVIRSARKTRWYPLLASKHGQLYQEKLRPVVRPLTSVDIDVLLGLFAIVAAKRSRGLGRVALLALGSNGLRRGLGGGRLAGAEPRELPALVAVALGLPAARAFWLVEGSIRFRRVNW
jgi:glycosyltransferase involved in cell wall biosynthesis